MDVNHLTIKLHPQANDFLFEHYRTLSRIFSDVLGLLEVDYLSIAFINTEQELLFFSSHPSIECNLIEHDLWKIDPIYDERFFIENRMRWWDELYSPYSEALLIHYKQQAFKFRMGFAIPAQFNENRVVYSFAFTCLDSAIKKRVQKEIDTLRSMGKYCLNNILKAVPLPERKRVHIVKKPNLKLIINNQVNYESIT